MHDKDKAPSMEKEKKKEKKEEKKKKKKEKRKEKEKKKRSYNDARAPDADQSASGGNGAPSEATKKHKSKSKDKDKQGKEKGKDKRKKVDALEATGAADPSASGGGTLDDSAQRARRKEEKRARKLAQSAAEPVAAAQLVQGDGRVDGLGSDGKKRDEKDKKRKRANEEEKRSEKKKKHSPRHQDEHAGQSISTQAHATSAPLHSGSTPATASFACRFPNPFQTASAASTSHQTTPGNADFDPSLFPPGMDFGAIASVGAIDADGSRMDPRSTPKGAKTSNALNVNAGGKDRESSFATALRSRASNAPPPSLATSGTMTGDHWSSSSRHPNANDADAAGGITVAEAARALRNVGKPMRSRNDAVGKRKSQAEKLDELKRMDKNEVLTRTWLGKKDLDALGIKYKIGKFTTREDEKIHAHFDALKRRLNLSEEQLRDLIYAGASKAKEGHKGFWFDVTSALGDRPVQTVRHHVMRIYHAHARKGPFSKEEDEALERLLLEHGPKWQKIGALIERSGPDCRDRWRFALKDKGKNTGVWSAEEEEQLRKAMKEVRKMDAPNNWFLWGQVAGKMGGQRTALQCRVKWLGNLEEYPTILQDSDGDGSDDDEHNSDSDDRREPAGTKKKKEWNIGTTGPILVEKLRAYESERDADFMKLSQQDGLKGITYFRLRAGFKRLKKMAIEKSGNTDLSWPELLDEMMAVCDARAERGGQVDNPSKEYKSAEFVSDSESSDEGGDENEESEPEGAAKSSSDGDTTSDEDEDGD